MNAEHLKLDGFMALSVLSIIYGVKCAIHRLCFKCAIHHLCVQCATSLRNEAAHRMATGCIDRTLDDLYDPYLFANKVLAKI
jgi:hypothetical protein